MEHQLADLPPELVLHIFHCAAAFSTQFCLTLCLVSSWTRHLALPHLFSTAIIKSHRAEEYLCQRIRVGTLYNPPSANFQPALSVRNIWIGAVVYRMPEIFQRCDNIANMVMTQTHFFGFISLSIEGRLPEKSIECKPDLQLVLLNARGDWPQRRYANEDPSLNTPLFNKITRLRLAQISHYRSQPNIAHFTRLTHFALPFYVSTDHRLSELDHLLELPSIKMLVIVVFTDLVSLGDRMEAESWVRAKRQTTSIVHIVESVSNEIQQEWEEEVRGGKSLWDRAVHRTFELMNYAGSINKTMSRANTRHPCA